MARDYGVMTDPVQLGLLVRKMLEDGLPIAFDIETGYEGAVREKAALHPEEAFVVGFSFTNSMDWARYVPLAHPYGNMDIDAFVEIMQPVAASGLGVAHNASFECRFLRPLGLDFKMRSDTMIEAYILSEWKALGLKYLTSEVFHHEQAEISSLFPDVKKGKMKTIRFNDLEVTPEVTSYACEDSVWCLGLHERNYPKVKDLFIYKTEMALLPVLIAMEEYGVYYDWDLMNSTAVRCERFMNKMYQEILSDLTAKLGRPVAVNLGSPKQIADILFGEPPLGLGMKPTQRTNTGAPSTNATALNKLAKQFPVVERITQWKELKKLLSTYLQKYPKVYAYAPDGRTHPNIMQTAVITGRFAVSDPPYQQTPKKYKYELDSGERFEFNFRNVIKAGPEHYLLGYDYSQIELRVMAGEAQEPALLHAFDHDEDVHTATASLMLNVPKDQVTEDQRAIGKTMNFALLYGMGAKQLAQRLAVDVDKARELYDSYFSSYSAISVWVDRMKAEGKARGYSQSRFGRKHTIWELTSSDAWIYSKGERLCVNAPVQGGAADYMKIAMVRANAALTRAGLLDRVHLIMNIHDALVFEVHESVDFAHVVNVLQPAVSFPVDGYPKVVADWEVGQRWGEMKKLTLYERAEGWEVLLPADDSQRSAVSDDDFDPEGGDVVVNAAAVLEAPPEPVHDQADDALGKADIAPAQEAAEALELEHGQRLIVEISEMPDSDQFRRWLDLLAQRKGRNTVLLRTPEGDLDYEDSLGTNLTPDDAPAVSLIFAGASVFYDAATVDTSAVLSDLQL